MPHLHRREWRMSVKVNATRLVQAVHRILDARVMSPYASAPSMPLEGGLNRAGK